MFLRRSYAIAIAALALAGCASGGYSSQYPGGTYNGSNPYYGGGYGYDGEGQSGQIFQPERDVTCDRAHDLCYDQFGPSYVATRQYLGKHAADRAADRYGDQLFVFSPQDGVVCDRRKRACFEGDGVDRRLTREIFSNAASDPYWYYSGEQGQPRLVDPGKPGR